MIEIPKIKEPRGKLYKLNGDEESIYVGEIKGYAQYLAVKVKIKEAQESGYYVVFNGETVALDRNGTEDYFPEGYFGDMETDFLLELVSTTHG